MNISDGDIKRFSKVLFKRAFALGAFKGDLSKVDEAYNLMVIDLKENYETEPVKEMIKVITD